MSPQGDIFTRTRLFDFAARRHLSESGIDFSGQNITEGMGNLSGGRRKAFGFAGQNSISARFDLFKLFDWQGATFVATVSERYGISQAAKAGIPAIQLTNEIYGRSQTYRLTEFYLQQKLFDGLLEMKVGRMPVSGDFQFQRCDFINLAICGGQVGNLVGDYVYNWPISQWGAVAKINFLPEFAFRIGAFDRNPEYLKRRATYALLPTFPDHSVGVLIPVELNWKPEFWFLPPGDWRIGAMFSTENAKTALLNVTGAPNRLTDGLSNIRYQGRSVFYFSILQPLTGNRNAPDPKAGVFAFINGAFGDNRTSNAVRLINAGLVQRGIGTRRPQDEVGIGFGATTMNARVARLQSFVNDYNFVMGQSGIGAHAARTEYVTEVFYTIQVTGWLKVQLDGQWIHKPGGYASKARNFIDYRSNKDAFLLGLRTTTNF